ncbi:hypothetical protein [Bradyrhizobium ottawaense]|uniref:Uncharacterized protein n=1 Tax=Bradyrhizobium ottawaense TaxID=931866 RepID=A0ABY0QHC5_9BRAD|nr:hypothetical protein [Bradyrhizobium ottawaense]SDK44006.1 hypothetical protein SAMN05444163_8116 [Bradyrhizobium ottawaense]
MKRLFHAVMNGISTVANYWWAGVIYMAAGIDITEPHEERWKAERELIDEDQSAA